MIMSSRMLIAVLGAMLFSVSPASQGQGAPRSYAVLSLAGNAISVHTIRPEVGSRTSADSKFVLPITEPVFDVAALKAANNAILSFHPGAKVVLMTTQDAGLYQAQNAMFEAAADNKENRDYLVSLLKDRGVSHLVLITRLRANAAFKVRNGHTGSGSLEGLGFFIDDTTLLRDTVTNDSSIGMLTPFAHVKLRLLDAKTLELVREGDAVESTIIHRPSAVGNAMEMWTSLTSATKIDYIDSLLVSGMKKAMPELLGK
jgi:hypothetical protein